MGFFNNNEMTADSSPFVWSVNPDNKEPTKFRCYISPHVFSLVDLNVYALMPLSIG